MAPDSARREFLKTGAALFTTSPFTGRLRGANDKPKIAFIGCGPAGCRNLNFAARAGGVEIAAVCDVYGPARECAARLAGRLGFRGVEAHRDFREILADPSIDAVAIAAPDRWHASLTIEACKAGKDVWCETPACLSVEEGLEMVQAARRYRRVVQAGTVQRSGGFRKAREMVRSGDLGEIAFCNAFEAVPAGATTDSRVQLLDAVQFVFDEAMPVSISAQDGLATFRYPGFVAAYESRTATPFDNRSYGTAFHGSKGTLVVNRGDSRGRTAANVAHWANFLECLRTRRKPVSDIETCVRSTTTCLLSDLSLRHGVTVGWDEQAFTVKQPELRPFLKARYRSPWKPEV